MSDNWKKGGTLGRIASAERGENPTVIARMRSGYAVMGDTQFLPGYCVLLAVPAAPSLHELDLGKRAEFLLDMSLLGDAVAAVYQPRRVNYSIYGNADPFLHAHLFPRYGWEPAEYSGRPQWNYPYGQRHAPEHDFNEERHGEQRSRLAAKLLELMQVHGTLPEGRPMP